MKSTIRWAIAAVLIGISTITASPTFANNNQVNIYSYRQPELIAPVLNAFTEETGIETRVLNLRDGMVERLKAEGINSPADVILTVDIGRLMDIKDGGVTQPVSSTKINANIPEHYRDPDGNWFGLTLRARVVLASKERVEQDSITYAELADPKWNERICIRSGQHPYNIALIASIIANEGEERAKEWLIGLKNNLARSPVGNDRAQVQGIFSGECDLAIGYTYYMGLMRTNKNNPEQKDWEASVKVLFPDQNGRGTHVNVSGMAMAKNAPNQQNALALMEFLSSPKAQEIYAEQVFEYPISPDAQPSEITKSYGELVADTLPIVEIARWRAAASLLVDQVGFND
ncbi:MAG: Fe(3+) ABC transporter substrate-binding protein [Devosiaceae bacterium]|nr:Fe(3+) ABC transporter substrate-binding protein [Devosiaceae bacterium]